MSARLLPYARALAAGSSSSIRVCDSAATCGWVGEQKGEQTVPDQHGLLDTRHNFDVTIIQQQGIAHFPIMRCLDARFSLLLSVCQHVRCLSLVRLTSDVHARGSGGPEGDSGCILAISPC